ncbi:hypothetical protein [Actinomadura rudentiformis]|uniref:Uncharacterized protein n=1 Tax=Actinomadura rudentiformis TaxID=359158 RepID=A0A6H9YWT2_9ACTN|nr:hypothetical protein [Actinomadura rudentiformis]KAB2351697.1 hypothetical protein F8566_05630 [Actinomadura rudentiformis]
MDFLATLILGNVVQTASLLMESRQVIGLVAAFLAAVLAAQLGWHGTDRLIAWRSRPDQD